MDEISTICCSGGWIWLVFVFALGACVGSFLNVVIFRLPLEKSIVSPPSACPACGRRIMFYDNIPLLSWLILGGKCRNCKSKISVRYFLIELLTAVMFAAVFVLYFAREFGFGEFQIRSDMPSFAAGGWLIYLLHITLLSSLLASSAIDLEHWVIPISICWFATIIGVLANSTAAAVISSDNAAKASILLFISPKVIAITLGASAGLAIAIIMLITGLIKPSYEISDDNKPALGEPDPDDPAYNHRLEAIKEIVFLLPVIVLAFIGYLLFVKVGTVENIITYISEISYLNTFFGALFGYFAGAGIVWATRILGTFAFGKEAMGLGDVHLLAAGGACIGAADITVAFFIAPFFGLFWALYQILFKKCRQIPYGPFLSAAIFVVILANQPIMDYIYKLFYIR